MNEFEALRGSVIMFDGPDGVGKTTQIELLQAELENHNVRVDTTAVNGGTPIGKALRGVFLGEYERPVETDLHIGLAQHYALAPEIKEFRRSGTVILVDRSPLSIIAYQVFGSGLDKELGYRATEEAVELYNPELVIVYKASIGALITRQRLARKREDHFVNKTLKEEDLAKRSAGYEDAAAHFGAKVIDANGSVEEVHGLTMAAIVDLARQRSSGA